MREGVGPCIAVHALDFRGTIVAEEASEQLWRRERKGFSPQTKKEVLWQSVVATIQFQVERWQRGSTDRPMFCAFQVGLGFLISYLAWICALSDWVRMTMAERECEVRTPVRLRSSWLVPLLLNDSCCQGGACAAGGK